MERGKNPYRSTHKGLSIWCISLHWNAVSINQKFRKIPFDKAVERKKQRCMYILCVLVIYIKMPEIII